MSNDLMGRTYYLRRNQGVIGTGSNEGLVESKESFGEIGIITEI